MTVLNKDALLDASVDLYRACAAQHDAIDRLFAMLVLVKPEFRPSESGQPWRALLAGNAAMDKADKLNLGKKEGL